MTDLMTEKLKSSFFFFGNILSRRQKLCPLPLMVITGFALLLDVSEQSTKDDGHGTMVIPQI